MNIDAVLKNIGFEDNEIQIYLFLLRSGSNSQQAVSDKTGILRQTVYDVMKKMETKGYISHSLVGKRKIYSAMKPELILQQLKEKEEQFIELLPELEKLQKQEQIHLFSQSFVGIKGLKNLFNLTLESDSEILWLVNRDMSDKVFFGYYWHNYAKKRITNKIPIKLLIECTQKKDWDTDKNVWRETRKNKLVKNIESSFVLFDDKIIIYSMVGEQLFGLFIQNLSMKNFFEIIFYNLWNNSK